MHRLCLPILGDLSFRKVSVASRSSERLRLRAKAAAALEGPPPWDGMIFTSLPCAQLVLKSLAVAVAEGMALLALVVVAHIFACMREAACTSSTFDAFKFGLEWRTPAHNAACDSAGSANIASCLESAGPAEIRMQCFHSS